jgi:peptidoglycan/LPS O-acetylase OafA/YrhL
MPRFPRLHLQRITSGSSWIPEIDGLRFVAILSVVLFHLAAQVSTKSSVHLTAQTWYQPLFNIMARGHIGVPLFFVISGFILGRPFARQYLLGQNQVRLRSYYLRRITRLEPPYVLNLILSAIAIYLYFGAPIHYLLTHFAASAAYLHGWIFREANPINNVAWTLEVEVQFYILVPLLTLLFCAKNVLLRRGVLLASILILPFIQARYLFGHLAGDSWLWFSIFFYLQYFLAGLLLSDLYVTNMPGWGKSWLWDVASVAAWLLLFVYVYNWVYYAEALIILVAYIGAFRGRLFPRIFRTPWIALIGGMCYSMYLWHFFIIALIFKMSHRVVITRDLLVNFLLQATLILPCILAGTLVYFILIERPCMDPAWPRKLKAALSREPGRPVV